MCEGIQSAKQEIMTMGLAGENMFPGGGGEIILEKTMEGSRGRRWCCELVATRSN